MSNWNPWKTVAIGMGLVIATALIAGFVVASWKDADNALTSRPSAAVPPTAPPPSAAPGPAAVPSPARAGSANRVASNHAPPAPIPTAAVVDACNESAKAQAGDKTLETVKDALIGAVAGAGVGAAGGAMAGGGKGAGKGAGIGGVVGAAAGTLYGLNEGKSHDARYVQAYRSCMKTRGYTG
jgi:hypothetical protein